VKTKIHYATYQKLDRFMMFIVYCFDYYVSSRNCRFCFEDVNDLLLQLIRIKIVKFKKKQEITHLEAYNHLI